MVQEEHLFALLDPGFNGLACVVMGEPSRQILRDGIRTEMKQGAVLEGLAGIEAFQCDIQWIGALLELEGWPGNQFGVGPDTGPNLLVVHLLPEIGHNVVAVRLGVDFIAHLDQQGYVFVRAETGIQAKFCFDWLGVVGILRFETGQTLVQPCQRLYLLFPASCGFVQPPLRFFPGLLPAEQSFVSRLRTLASLR